MKRYIILGLISILFIKIANGQDRVTTNPDSANIITTDIDNFWRAFDLLQNQKTLVDSLKIIKTIYVDKASEGLKQYMKAANCDENGFLDALKKKKADYLAIRENTEAIAGEKQLIIRISS